ncbi:MAG: DUF998 domain-containing protein [Actinomycetota bacterium]
MQADRPSSPAAGTPLAILAAVAILGTAYFVVDIVGMHFLSPEISPVHRPTSEYATGPFGYLMTSAFVSLSLGTWALVLGLRRDLPSAGPHRVGLVFLGIWGIGLLVAATFQIDPEGASDTVSGTIHSINGPLTFLSLVIGTNLVSRGFKQDVRWSSIHRLASGLALFMIPAFVVGGLTAARESGAGIAQRVLIVTFASWFLLVAARLWSNAASTRS